MSSIQKPIELARSSLSFGFFGKYPTRKSSFVRRDELGGEEGRNSSSSKHFSSPSSHYRGGGEEEL